MRSRNSICGIAHKSVPTGPKTPDSPALGPKVCPYMSWRCIKMRAATYGRAADDGRPSRSMAGEIGSELSASPGGERRMGIGSGHEGTVG